MWTISACTRRSVIATSFVVAFFALAVPSAARATAHDELSGWAWNSSTGWISMNRQNCLDLNTGAPEDPCVLGGVDYRVHVDDLGYLTGYAWSQSAGWICFGAECVGSGGATPNGGWSARIDAVSQQVAGWAKVLALGDGGWLSLSCENTQGSGCADYRTSWVPIPITGGLGRIEGNAWNGSTVGSALGWVSWQPGFEAEGGGVRSSWDPEPHCAESGNACTGDFDCAILGELCCLGGADCGQCAADRCGFAGDCTVGDICCPSDDPLCGRCVQDAARCAGDADCPDLAVDSCCPPGAVCTRTHPSVGTTGTITTPVVVPGTLGGAVGFCANSLGTGAPVACVDDPQCGGSSCSTAPQHGLCTTNEAQDCTNSAECGSGACSVEVGACSAPNGSALVSCLTDSFCASHSGIGDPNAVCRKIIGECSAVEVEPKLCVDDANCVSPDSRCEHLYLPWLQTEFGPIYSEGGVGSPQTTPPPPGRANATYCILSGGPIINFLSDPGACDAGPETLTQTPYASSVARLDVPGILLGRYGEVVGPPSGDAQTPFETDANGLVLDGKIYLVDHPPGRAYEVREVLFRNSFDASKGSGLIVISGGDLVITKDVRYYDDASPPSRVEQFSSPGWLVLADRTDPLNPIGGNIIIDPSVQEIVGAFYAEGEIRTGTTGSRAEAPLLVRGVMIARSFLFERSHGSPTGAERVVADGRVLVNTPPGFGDLVKSLPRIAQTVPE